MIHLIAIEKKSLGEQYILLKRKTRKLEKLFTKIGSNAVLAQERVIRTMMSVDKKIKYIEEVIHAAHK